MNLDKFTIVSYDQIAGFDRQAGMLALVMDEINDFTLSQEEEKNDITGKGGRVIGSQKKNKKVTGKGTNGMLSGGALAAQLGADIEDGDQIVKWTDVITVTASTPEQTKTFKVLVRFDADADIRYYKNGGILPMVVRKKLKGA